ncbi:hypothetical protein [Bacteroides sp. 224]|uniref:hypothetical protein n=1 Tax=Bacteroides sp. 224 TaxID=2302936 RepID=UPI0013D16896|nr:hypothetical protein [Bacteroides sp. 224]
MTKYIKYFFICFWWGCLFMLTSCHEDEPIITPPAERNIIFEMEIVNGTAQTRMTANEEKAIKNIYILAFNTTGATFNFGASATHTTGTTYKVPLPAGKSFNMNMFFVILVNYTPTDIQIGSFPGKTYTQIINSLIVKETNLSADCIPMIGVTESKAINTTTNPMTLPTFSDVKLVRMLAKITVINENGKKTGTNYNNFVLEGVTLVNRPLAGYLGYSTTYNTNLPTKISTTNYYKTNTYTWAANAISLSNTNLPSVTISGDPKKEIAEPIYTFEHPEPASTAVGAKHTYLLISGKRADIPYSYKVYIPSLNYSNATIPPISNSKGPIVRNHHYTLRIQEARSLDLTFLFTIMPWTNVPMIDDLLDTTYKMELEPRNMIFQSLNEKNTHEMSFYSDYMWDYEIFTDKECTNKVNESDIWLTLTNLPSKNFTGKNGVKYYPATTSAITIGVQANKNLDDPHVYYVKFTGYGTDEIRNNIVYESVSLLATITRGSIMKESNCYMVDNGVLTEFGIPLSQIKKGIEDKIITDNIDTWIPVTDRGKLRAQVFWTDLQKPSIFYEGLFDTGDAVVKSVTYKPNANFYEGYIHVVPGTGIGNAGVILYLDMDGSGKYDPTKDKICWSWHIWNTQSPPEVASGEFLDRNLGAYRPNPEPGDLFSVGFFYQWGRKDPLPGLTSWEVSENTIADLGSYNKVKIFFNPATTNGVTKALYTPKSGPSGITESVKNPLTPYWGWASVTEAAFWNSKTSTNPCPVGYKVPNSWNTAAGWANKVGGIYAYNNQTTGYLYGQYNAAYGGYYPAAGYGFHQGKGVVADYVVGSSTEGYYWSANYSASVGLKFNGTTVSSSASLTHEHGTPIRCIKE